jgi:cell division septal protein FtsQ
MKNTVRNMMQAASSFRSHFITYLEIVFCSSQIVWLVAWQRCYNVKCSLLEIQYCGGKWWYSGRVFSSRRSKNEERKVLPASWMENMQTKEESKKTKIMKNVWATACVCVVTLCDITESEVRFCVCGILRLPLI